MKLHTRVCVCVWVCMYVRVCVYVYVCVSIDGERERDVKNNKSTASPGVLSTQSSLH